MDEAEKCGNCRFSTPTSFKNGYNHEVEAVYCRYDPPTHINPNGFSGFPRLHPNAWCGRWQSIVTPEVVSETKEWATQ